MEKPSSTISEKTKSNTLHYRYIIFFKNKLVEALFGLAVLHCVVKYSICEKVGIKKYS